jgi:hypothetical protein
MGSIKACFDRDLTHAPDASHAEQECDKYKYLGEEINNWN